MIATIDVGQLAELVWVAIAAGIAVALCFSLAIVGSVRAGEMRRAGRGGAATAHAILALVALAAVTGLVVFGLIVIVAK
jgi:hypothetical protein